MKRIKERSLAYIQLLQQHTHYTLYNITSMKPIIVTRLLRRYLVEHLGIRPEYKVFWLSTTNGTLFCVSGDLTVFRMLPDFIDRAITLQHCTSADVLYAGRGKSMLGRVIEDGVNEYLPRGYHQRAFGGSATNTIKEQEA